MKKSTRRILELANIYETSDKKPKLATLKDVNAALHKFGYYAKRTGGYWNFYPINERNPKTLFMYYGPRNLEQSVGEYSVEDWVKIFHDTVEKEREYIKKQSEKDPDFAARQDDHHARALAGTVNALQYHGPNRKKRKDGSYR